MKKQSAFLSSKVLFVTLVIAASLMLLGSFVDYPLSCALYNRSNPRRTWLGSGRLFAAA